MRVYLWLNFSVLSVAIFTHQLIRVYLCLSVAQFLRVIRVYLC